VEEAPSAQKCAQEKSRWGCYSEPQCVGDISSGKREIPVFWSVWKRNIFSDLISTITLDHCLR